MELSEKMGRKSGQELEGGAGDGPTGKSGAFPSEGHALVYSLAKRLRERAQSVNAFRANPAKTAADDGKNKSAPGARTSIKNLDLTPAEKPVHSVVDDPERPEAAEVASQRPVSPEAPPQAPRNREKGGAELVEVPAGKAEAVTVSKVQPAIREPQEARKSASSGQKASPQAETPALADEPKSSWPEAEKVSKVANPLPAASQAAASQSRSASIVQEKRSSPAPTGPERSGAAGGNADAQEPAIKSEPQPAKVSAPTLKVVKTAETFEPAEGGTGNAAGQKAPAPQAESKVQAAKAAPATPAKEAAQADAGAAKQAESGVIAGSPAGQKASASQVESKVEAVKTPPAAPVAAPVKAVAQADAGATGQTAEAAVMRQPAPPAATRQPEAQSGPVKKEPAPEAVAQAAPAQAAAAQAAAAKAPDAKPQAGSARTADKKADAPQAKVDTSITNGKATPGAAKTLEAERSAPAKTVNGSGGGSGGKGSGGGGGGNGGGGDAPPKMQKRFSDDNFRNVLTDGLATVRRNLITIGVFSFFVNLIVLAIPIYLFQISDRVLTSRSTDTLVMLTIIVVGALLVHTLLDMIRRMILMRIAVDTETRLGPSVLSAAAKASQNGSNREYQILHDLQQLRNFITGSVLLTFFDLPVMPIYLVVVFLIHPDLGYIVTGTGAILLVIALINQKLTAVPFGRANAYATRANLQADAMSRNAQVINAMGMIPEGVQLWGRESVESLKAQVTAQDYNVLLAAISKFTRLTTQVSILGWGAWLALHAEITGGMLIAASIIGSRALAPIEGAIEGWRGFVHARSAYARIRTLLVNSPLNLERLRLPRPRGLVTVERVLYVPPPTKKVILNGISFELQPGESLAIVGSSGAGKSTLARMLVGSIVPTAGNIRLDYMDLRNWDPRQFGESVGYLPQDVQLFPATIKANIARMREDADDEAIFDAAETADVHEMISQFAAGYETMIGIDGAPLSGGQKQRIGLARAFFGDPRMVVLDEPNSNLDVPGERALARALTRAKAKEITIIAITQRPTLLKSVDKIMLLKDGTVQALGKRDDMLQLLQGGGRSLEAGGSAKPRPAPN